MGFWSALKKIGSVAAPIAASFIPGASLGVNAVKAGLEGGGKILGGMADASAAGRTQEDQRNLSQDSLRVSDEANFRNTETARAKLGSDLRTAEDDQARNAYKDALKAALARNMQDVSFEGMPSRIPRMSFKGGSRPSAIGAGGKEAAAIMEAQALQRLLNPEKRAELSPLERVKMSDPKKAGMFEKIAGPLGLGASVAGQLLQEQGPAATASDIVDQDLLSITNAMTNPPKANFPTTLATTMKER